ncbi:MAG: caspase family protein [Alphaproteobacteria bacterium]|nr:caspase family protein [Alphaproteobacteria bacterium]
MRPLLPLLSTLALASPAARAEVVRHALIVGSNAAPVEPDPALGRLEPLRYAEDDATRVAELLVELGGFDSADVTILRSPSAAQLDAALAAHRELAATWDEDLFLFYYSGHADQLGLRLGEESVGFDHLREEIRSVPAEVRLGVLDSCRSGEITRLKGLALATPFLDEQALSAEGEAWLTATSADEAAQESDTLRGSFFTHYLLSGLRGAADADDGVVSLDEAYTYAFERTVARTGRTSGGAQHPEYDYRIQGKGDLPLTDVRRASARLRLPPDMAGVVTILREPEQLPVAEVAKSEGAETVVALPPGTYTLRLSSAGTLKEGRLGLSDGAVVTVPALAFASADRRVALKGSAAEAPGEPTAGGAAEPAVPAAGADADGYTVYGTSPDWKPKDDVARAAAEADAAPGAWKQLGAHAKEVGRNLTYGLGRSLESAGRGMQGGGPATEDGVEPTTDPPARGSADEADTVHAPPPDGFMWADASPSADDTDPAAAAPLALPADGGAASSAPHSAAPDDAVSEGTAIPEAPEVVAPPDRGERAPREGGLDLRHSPVIGAGASLLLPGAGQAYNGQWVKGGAMLGTWALATGGSFGIQAATKDTLDGWNGTFLGITPGAMFAQAVRGWAAADAWQFHKQERYRPVTGVALGYSTAWRGADEGDPTVYGDVAIDATGLTLDWTMSPGFSLGIDRTGYLARPDGTVIVDTGARMTFALWERGRIRPGLFLFGGLEIDSAAEASKAVQSQAGFGGNLRWYVTPRYFVELEGRGTWAEEALRASTAAGFGVHFGAPGQGRRGREDDEGDDFGDD